MSLLEFALNNCKDKIQFSWQLDLLRKIDEAAEEGKFLMVNLGRSPGKTNFQRIIDQYNKMEKEKNDG